MLIVTLITIFVDGGSLTAWRDGSLFGLKGMTDVLFEGSGGKPNFVGAAPSRPPWY